MKINLPDDPRQQAKIVIQRRDEAIAAAAAVAQSMRSLVQESRCVPSGLPRLQLQRRGRDGTEALRWTTWAGRMLRDDEIHESIAGYPDDLRDWFGSMYVKTRWLNIQARFWRFAVKELSALAAVAAERQ